MFGLRLALGALLGFSLMGLNATDSPLYAVIWAANAAAAVTLLAVMRND